MAWYILLLVKWMHEKLGFSNYNHSVSAHYVQLASRSRTFNCTAAQKHFGYSPVVSLEVSLFFKFHFFLSFPMHLLICIICRLPLTCLSFVYNIIGLPISQQIFMTLTSEDLPIQFYFLGKFEGPNCYQLQKLDNILIQIFCFV